ncbi:Hypothetical predicted protein [Mytilus galloprovincialis]|uniref:Immunoglobulin domain-containing protein n=1 Tax=Mytilus galloprovincialis TaxID=29158 RepID=A0A8B6GTN9_MYTGA|nr:Hypothetical predicted protein [Mytilus galloprovincialis]
MQPPLVLKKKPWLMNISHSVNYEEHTVYASLGETVVLPFKDSRVSTLIWKRNENIIISDGSLINTKINGKERFRIIVDRTVGEYNLEISNITESDLGLYWCEFQIENTAVQNKVVLKIADNISTVVTDLYTEQSTVKDDTSTRYVSVAFKTYTANSTTPHSVISTNHRNEESTVFVKPEMSTGFSSDEKFLFYGLVAAGLVLVLCLSIVCNICINRKCRTENLATKNNVPNVNSVAVIQEPSLEPEDSSSTYEVICESEMLPFEKIKLNTNASLQQSLVFEKKFQNNSPISDKPYFEVIDGDNIYLNPCHTIEGQEQTDNLKKISSPEYQVALPATGTICCAGQNQNQSSDNDNKVKVQESSDMNIKIQIYPADDISVKYSVGEDIKECLKRYEVDENNRLLVQRKENTESMSNFIELSETSSSDDNEEKPTVQTDDDYINPYQTLKRSEKDDEHDYNICAVP